MADWVFQEQTLGLQPIADTSTTQRHPLGTIVRAKHETLGGGEFIYLKGVASTVVGSWVTYSLDDGSTALLVANAIGPVAVALSANVASQYGWYQISGKASARAEDAMADNANVYIGGTTAGEVDDAVVDGDMVHLAKCASTIAAQGLGEFEISRPYTDDITTND